MPERRPGWRLVDPSPGPGGPRPTTPDGVPVGALGRRLAARVTDWVLKMMITAGVGFTYLRELADAVAAWETEHRTTTAELSDVSALAADPRFQDASTRFLLVAVLVSLVYTVPAIALLGTTPGKRAFGIRVRSFAREARPTWGESLLRWLTREGARHLPIVGFMYLVMDSAWPLWDPYHQALHDKLPRTVAVAAAERG